MSLSLRTFSSADAAPVSALIGRALREVNRRDYSAAAIEELAEAYSPDGVLREAETAHLYVALRAGRIVGVAGIRPVEETPGESLIVTVFTLPEEMGRGVGTALMKQMEKDPLFRSAKRVSVSSSITAVGFYEKLGYQYPGGTPVLEDEDHYWMEKIL